ncbi:MAG: helicase-related protein [Pseudorhodoplanes sp.]|nr:helicase-related protein [Pseudorhodoplanes sp.]
MTATPIPRTLVLTYFGDMDVSRADREAGRPPADRHPSLPLDRLDEVVAAVGRAVDAEGAGLLGLPAGRGIRGARRRRGRGALRRARPALRRRVGARPRAHERAEKDTAMARFAAGETRLLVATTVIEVGVDVPEATVMVIEHAERFGLAQLHQLRGRVGRGHGRSTCLLLYKRAARRVAKARLAIMRETEDGFRIAEEDLRLRGEGEVLGTRQSGMPASRRIARTVHLDMLEAARDDARLLALDGDPG